MKSEIIGISVCTLGVLVSCALFFGYDWGPDIANSRNSMLLEVFKFSVTSVFVGGAVLIYNAQRERFAEIREKDTREDEKRAIQRDQLESFLREFSDTYNDIKYYRRELRHQLKPASGEGFTIDVAEYKKAMRALNLHQLRLEKFQRLLASKSQYLIKIAEKGSVIIEHVLIYLREVTIEYESRYLIATEDGTHLEVPPESKLFEFSVSSRYQVPNQRCLKEFFEPLDLVSDAILNQIEQHNDWQPDARRSFGWRPKKRIQRG